MTLRYQKLEEEYQNLVTEYNIQKCKLESKTEAVLILTKELEHCRNEGDQYRLMAEQLRDRYSTLKKRVEGWGPSLMGVYDVRGLKGHAEQSLAQLLCELKEQNKFLQSEVDVLKLKLADAQEDIKLLRNQINKQRRSSEVEETSPVLVPSGEREKLVAQLESLRAKCSLLERDLQAIIDEKEELVTARDAYRHKVDRLNQQLNVTLRGDEKQMVDIDAVLMENRYLHERLQQAQEEKSLLSASLSKYKNMLEKKRGRGGLRLGSTPAVSTKQIQQFLQSGALDINGVSPEIRGLVLALLETLNDKTLALNHQRKTNKILGKRITELEAKLKSSGPWHSLLSSSDKVQKLHDESLDLPVKTESMEDRYVLGEESGELQNSNDDDVDEDASLQSELSSRRGSSMSDLDVLPTKDTSGWNTSYKNTQLSSAEHSSSQFAKESTDDDDLPPELQKLIVAAMKELDVKDRASPTESPVHVEDHPNC